MPKADKALDQPAKKPDDRPRFKERVCLRFPPEVVNLGNAAMDRIKFRDVTHAITAAVIQALNPVVPQQDRAYADPFMQMTFYNAKQRMDALAKKAKEAKEKK